MEGIFNEFRGFYIVAALFAAYSLIEEFYRMAHGKMQCFKVAVTISIQMLVIYGSFCYLSAITVKLMYWHLYD